MNIYIYIYIDIYTYISYMHIYTGHLMITTPILIIVAFPFRNGLSDQTCHTQALGGRAIESQT